MNNPEPTDMNGTPITDLIDMVRKRMGIDLELLGASFSASAPPHDSVTPHEVSSHLMRNHQTRHAPTAITSHNDDVRLVALVSPTVSATQTETSCGSVRQLDSV